MSILKACKTLPVAVADLMPVAEAVTKHFADLDYEVSGEQTGPQRWEIGIHKGGTFRAVVGMKVALRIRIETIGSTTRVEAGIGLLESQGIYAAVSMLAFWPVLVTQTWGLLKQSKLDEEAIAVAEETLLSITATALFCHECGATLAGGAKFCSQCGVLL